MGRRRRPCASAAAGRRAGRRWSASARFAARRTGTTASWRRSKSVVRNVRAVRRRGRLQQEVPRLRRKGPDAQHARHARQEGQQLLPSVVLILRFRQPSDGRAHPVAMRVLRPQPAAVRPSRHWPPALVQVVRPGHNAVALHTCAGKCCAYATHGAVGTSRDRLTYCASCAAKDASLVRGWTGRCMMAECGTSVADGWTHDGCQACQVREKAEAEQ